MFSTGQAHKQKQQLGQMEKRRGTRTAHVTLKWCHCSSKINAVQQKNGYETKFELLGVDRLR